MVRRGGAEAPAAASTWATPFVWRFHSFLRCHLGGLSSAVLVLREESVVAVAEEVEAAPPAAMS